MHSNITTLESTERLVLVRRQIINITIRALTIVRSDCTEQYISFNYNINYDRSFMNLGLRFQYPKL